MFSSASDQYVNERKKQIWLVLLAYTSSVILRGVILLMTSLLDDYFECSSCEGIYILTSDNAIGQFLLVLIELNQLIPHVVIPVALYVIPVKTVKHTIKLEEELVDDEEIDQSEEIQRRVSNSIMTRSNSSLKSMDTINS